MSPQIQIWCLLIWCFSGLWFDGSAQVMDTLRPGNSSRYLMADGLPADCIEWMGQDRKGRYWYAACGPQQHEIGVKLFHFDGRSYFTVRLDTVPELGGNQMIVPFGIDDEGILTGFAGANKTLFWYNTETGDILTRSFADEIPGESFLAAIEAGGSQWVQTAFADSLYIHEIRGSEIARRLAVSRNLDRVTTSSSMDATSDDLWIWGDDGMLYQLGINSNISQGYTIPDWTVLDQNRDLRPRVESVTLPTGSTLIILTMHDQVQVLEFDRATNSIRNETSLSKDIGLTAERGSRVATVDQQGNVLFGYRNKEGDLTGRLWTKDGVKDYTHVLRMLSEQGLYLKLYSQDFTRYAVRYGRDHLHCEVLPPSSILKIPTDFGARAMINVDGQFFLRDSVFDATSGEQLYELTDDAFALGPTDVRHHAGLLWTTYQSTSLVNYDTKTHDIERIEVGVDIRRFLFLDNSTVIVAGLMERQDASGFSTTHLHKFDLASNELSPLTVNGDNVKIPGVPYCIISSVDGPIYLGTTSGIFEISSDLKSVQAVPQLAGQHVLALHQASSGDIWIGTFSGGLFHWNPESGEVNNITTERGLTNNAVVAVLEDNAGNIWANTYYGLNVINKDHEVISKIFEDNGLVDNEGNRMSSCTFPDGRLAFGSVAGASIVDPELYLGRLDTVSPLVYVTSLSYSSGDTTTRLQSPSEFGNVVHLDYSDRSVEINYALSSLIAPEQCGYAYRLVNDRQQSEWFYVGSSTTLNLRNLPAGKYEVQIKGTDHKGNWSRNLATVQIDAEEVLYRRTSFFIALIAILLGSIVAWQLYQRRIKRRLENEVRARTETISEQANKLKQLDEAKTRLYTNITHEFRTPLTVIAGSVEQIEGSEEEKDMIRRNSAQLLDLVNQMLDLRKLESGQLPVRAIQADVIGFIRYLSESFRSLAEGKGQLFHFLTDEQKFVMDYDPEKLTRIISNLLSNAIKFTPEGGNIYLNLLVAESSGREVFLIKVKDTGVGIPPDKVDQIFDRFYQVDDSATRAGEGTGIGLTLVKELTSVLGGEISVKSELGEGTTFSIELPVTREADSPSEELDYRRFVASAAAATALAGDWREEPVSAKADLPVALLVEDNADVLQYLIKSLASEYNIVLGMDGQEGIDKAIEEVPDIIVSDVMMPVKDGLELCDTLKRDVRTSHVPIVLLTARAELETRLEGLSRGADAYLSKPFNKEELTTVMGSLLRNRELLRERYSTIAEESISEEESVVFEDEFIQNFRNTVEANMEDENFGVVQMCKSLGVSRTQLHRKVTALTGHSTAQYMKLIRLNKARALLIEGELNVSQVAYSTGFRDPSYFGKVFQQEFGLTPGQFKAQQG